MGKITNRIGETAVANCGMEMTIIAYRGNKDVDVRFEDRQEVYHKSYSNFKKGTIAPPRDPRKERVGETAVAKCGMKMTIIAYRSVKDLDVRFEDGQESYHKSYGNFKKGTIAPPRDLRKERIGETAVANCGMKMTIIAYRGCNDIDVRFEDGQEVHHKTYQCFKNGTIAPPRDPRLYEHIGETAVATCGMKMTIIAYRGCNDIDVRFEDGQEAYQKSYSNFKNGTIAPPQDLRKERLGETTVANCGMEMTIIAYRNALDIDVRFEDGQEVYHKAYQCFKKGTIAPPKNRVGETTVANCGMKMTIIAYRSSRDIDVRFEDGQEVYHKSYSNFKSGTIAPPRDLRKESPKERVGETAVAKCGMKMTIIAYRSASDVDVRFEDGQESYHKEYSSFKNGAIAPPRDPRKERVGETAVAKCGMKMTIIAYRGCDDIDVRFEDGQEVYHKSYGNFKKGTIAPPKNRVGETAVANCGMEMTIIAYRSVKDVDVRFEDGQEVYHKAYGNFKIGNIAPPRDLQKERIGETAVATCGMEMTIIAYRSFADVDVRFEDGQEAYHKGYCNFKSGEIAHPQFNMKKKAKYKTLTTQSIGRISTGEVYFIAKCTRCGEVYAGTPQMIIAANHKCKEKNCVTTKTH